MSHCEFDKLFRISAPHILERVFFSLDYDSFMACREVCKTWRELYSSELYRQKAEELIEEKRNNEEKLWQFINAGNAEEVGKLLSSGVSPNFSRNGMTPLHNGMTPLHLAVQKGNEDVVKLLLNAGADTSSTIYCIYCVHRLWIYCIV